MTKIISGKAFAKLNLYLGVRGLRPDGYHELETVFQSIDLCDLVAITFHKRGGVSFRSNLPYLPGDSRNLAVKAAELFFQTTGLPNPGVHINIKKVIPVGAGMAGGSTDAACVLRLLNQAFGMPLSHRALAETALRLGADVPFCLWGGTALAGGVGEQLKPLPTLDRGWITVPSRAFPCPPRPPLPNMTPLPTGPVPGPGRCWTPWKREIFPPWAGRCITIWRVPWPRSGPGSPACGRSSSPREPWGPG